MKRFSSYKHQIIISLAGITCFIILLFSRCSNKESANNNNQLNGIWAFDDESAELELDASKATYHLSIPHASLEMEGHWSVQTSDFGNSRSSFLILKNEMPAPGVNSQFNEFYFNYYFFQIDKIADHQITLTDISSKNSVRRNHQFILVPKLK